MDKEVGKRLAAEEAAKHVENGMTLGLGTGSTAKHFVDILGERVAKGWTLHGIPTSEQTRAQAVSLGIEIIEPDETTVIDLAIDGADEVDPNLHLIKGGGGIAAGENRRQRRQEIYRYCRQFKTRDRFGEVSLARRN